MYKLNKDEKKNLDTNMLVHGYETYKTNFFDTKEYKDLVSDMIFDLPSFYQDNLEANNCTKNNLLKVGKEVINKHMSNTDTKVRYVDMDSLKADLYCLFGEEPKEEQYDEIIKYIDDNIELINVTDVPVEINLDSNRSGYTLSTWFYGPNVVKEAFYNKIKPVTKKISIEGACDDDTKCIYVHEMYHSLAATHKGSIENLLNEEVLPIYMEKVTASDIDQTGKLENIKILTRLLNNKNDILKRENLKFNDKNVLERINCEGYIVSSAIATSLYDTYKNSNNEVKKEIDDSINGIFREDHTLEDMLQQFDITPENGSKIMRKHIKKLSK